MIYALVALICVLTLTHELVGPVADKLARLQNEFLKERNR